MSLFSFLFLQVIKKCMPDFLCWIPFATGPISDVFRAQAKKTKKNARMALFSLFFSPKDKEKYAGFRQLNSNCKNMFLDVLWVQTKFSIFSQNGFIWLSFSPNDKKFDAGFPRLSSYCIFLPRNYLGPKRKCSFLVRVALFSFLFLTKRNKTMTGFQCWIPIVKLTISTVFWAQAKLFNFGPELLYFPFFLSK